MIKNKNQFKNKYIDLSNEELNGEVTEEVLVKLSECLGEIGFNFIIARNFIKEGSSCISAGRDDGEEEDIFYSARCVKSLHHKEVSIYDIFGMEDKQQTEEKVVSEDIIELDEQRPHLVVETWCPKCGKAAVNVVPENCTWDKAVPYCAECGGSTKCLTDVSTSDIAYFLSRKFHNKPTEEKE